MRKEGMFTVLVAATDGRDTTRKTLQSLIWLFVRNRYLDTRDIWFG